MRKINLILVVLLLLTNWALSACQSYEVSAVATQTFNIVSLKEYLPELQKVAKGWHQDAYLVEADIPIYFSTARNELWLINATFQSPAYENQSLLVELGIDKKIKIQVIEHSLSIVPIDPIEDDDWTVDSPQAITLFPNSHNLITSLEDGSHALLFLERRPINSQSLVVWRLAMPEEGTYLYLDATSGKEILIAQ